jgi:hypothetical protein
MSTKAKKHPLLGQVTAALSGRLPETTVDIMGTRYKLRLLKPEAEDWVAMNTPGTTSSAALLNYRKPTLAAALVSIATFDEESGNWQEMPVEALFEIPSDMDVRAKEMLAQDPKMMRDWRRGEVLEWLREDLDTVVLDRMFDAYSKMVPLHKEAMKEVSGFSKGTPSAV